ncbi:IS1595 family transposase [Marinicaulis aureus]|uniref:IS1595 family transposase n=1 Tax=Hyphococcus aureus TaxID=2666033 RepID=A0ABW1L1Z8_9PROT
MAVNLKDPIYKDEKAARDHLEALRWPDGAYCPRCGGFEVKKLGGKAADLGQYNCRDCRKKFTVTVGTLFERSHIPLTTWLMAFQLMSSSKKGMSAHQLHRMLGVTYKTAWFMAHRIREAMAPAKGSQEPMGGKGKVVEADETYHGKTKEIRTQSVDGRVKYKAKGRGGANKRTIIALVERGGSARTFHVAHATFAKVEQIVSENVDRESRLHTDESRLYAKSKVPTMVAEHESVRHTADEYVRGDVYSNSAENYFSVFKRGMKGVYQHCSEKHLHRYLAEFDFRYSNRSKVGVEDTERANRALQGIAGKRLTYRRTSEAVL